MMKYVQAFFCLFIESWMPTSLTFAQSPSLSTEQRQGDTIQVSINRSASPLGNDPLVVIDGVQSDIITLSTIYPADIESFTILKDASETSQYGSRGAAGVIQVVTKKGKAGLFHIAYDGSVGFESTYKNLHMLNANEFRQAAKSLGMDIIDKGAYTDFTEAPLRTGFVQNHHLAFGGGSETANYRASITCRRACA